MRDDYTKGLEAIIVDLIGMRNVEGIMELTGRPENVCKRIRDIVDVSVENIASDSNHNARPKALVADVKSLRERTGAGLHVCKAALEHYNLDYEKAFKSIIGGNFVRKDL